MSIVEIIDVFVFYGMDVITLACVSAILVQILKVTLLKNIQKKLITFLPFVIGTVLYGIYRGIYEWNAYFVLQNYVDVLEHGIAIGSLATLIYVLYEQFIRGESGSNIAEEVIASLIEGYVAEEKIAKTAKLIADAISRDVSGAGVNKTAEILKNNSLPEVEEKDIGLLSRLIIEALAKIC